MKYPKLLPGLLCLTALLMAFCGTALAASAGETGSNSDYQWVVNPDGATVTITKVLATDADLVVPATLDGLQVTVFGEGKNGVWPFPSSSKLKTVTLPEGLTSIGKDAFYHCSDLTRATFPSTLKTVGDGAFRFLSRLTQVEWNRGLQSIGKDAFGNTGLGGTLTLPDSVTTLGAGTFSDTKITAVGKLGSVTAWPDSLFNGCTKLTTVSVPVTTLGSQVFNGCTGLTSVILPEGLTVLGDGTFKGCSVLNSVTLPDSITDIGGGAFQNCPLLTNLTLPANLTQMGTYAFSGCRALEAIVLPDGLTTLKTGVFENCWALQSVTLPARLTTVESWAFSQCRALQTLQFPAGLQTLGGNVFSYANALREVTFLGSAPATNGRPLGGTQAALPTVYYTPAHEESFRPWITDWSTYFTLKCVDVKPPVPNAVTPTVALSAVLAHTRQDVLMLWLTVDVTPKEHPADAGYSPAGAIRYTLNGTALPPPTNFSGGNTATHQTVGYDVGQYLGTEITLQAFSAASSGFSEASSPSVTGLVVQPAQDQELPFVPASAPQEPFLTTSDGNGGLIITAIQGEMAGRPQPVLPAQIGGLPVTGLGDGLFRGNSFVSHVAIPASVKTLGAGVFQDCPYLYSVSLPQGLTQLPAGTFSGCGRLAGVVLPQGLTRLEANVFQNCTALAEMTFPASLISLDKDAFSGCGLLEVTFEGNAPAFNGTSAKTAFGPRTIVHTTPTATGFDVAPWVGIRKLPVALGLSYTATFDQSSKVLALTVAFDTSACPGATAPDLTQVTVKLNGHLMTGVTAANGVLRLTVPSQFLQIDPSVRIDYPGDWFFLPANTYRQGVVPKPAPSGGTDSGTTGGTGGTTAPQKGTVANLSLSGAGLTAAVQAAKKGEDVVLTPTVPQGATSMAVTLPAALMAAATDKGESALSLKTPVADIALDAKTLEAVRSASTKDVVLSAGTVEQKNLPQAAQALLAHRPVYDITITAGGKTVSSFDGGMVTVALPYTPAPHEQADSLVACWVKEDGTLEVLPDSLWQEEKLVFSTGHLSTYAIVERPDDFTDTQTHWAKSDIAFASAREMVNGMGGHAFLPDRAVTGAMAVTMLGRLSGVADAADSADWATPHLAWAKKQGYLPANFDPQADLPREQLALLLHRWLGGTKGTSAPVTYVDQSSISPDCLEAVQHVQALGLMRGRTDGGFDPHTGLSRAELASVMRRLVEQQLT